MKEQNLKNLQTELLYEKDAYKREFEAQVLSCEKSERGYEIVLNRTAFFPEGGGQSADIGTLKGYSVIDVIRIDERVIHICTHELTVGETVTGCIDWKARYCKMQNHTGEHLVSGLIFREYGYSNVGFHLGSDVVTVDANGILTIHDLQRIEQLANQAVCENVPVTAVIVSAREAETLNYRSKLDFEEDVRLVTIEGYDICACCAPHVASTAEIGVIKILGMENHRGGTRFTMLCGYSAYEDYCCKHNNVSEISVLLSAKLEETAEAVKNKMQQIVDLKNEITQIKRTMVERRCSELVSRYGQGTTDKTQNICLFEEDFDEIQLRNLVNVGMTLTEGMVLGFMGNPNGGYRYIFGSNVRNAREFTRLFHENFTGRGGGSERMTQGTVMAKREEIEMFVSTL